MVREDKRKILDSYDALEGRIYNIRYREEQEAKYDAILDRIGPLPHDIVLDDGCGTGLLISRLDAHNVGVDLSYRLLSTARSRLRGKPYTHLIQADADSLPFRPLIFCIVFSVTVVQNLPTLEQTLAEIMRVSRPGSQIAVTALKKAFSAALFSKALDGSGFNDICMIQDECLKDWLAFSKRKTY